MSTSNISEVEENTDGHEHSCGCIIKQIIVREGWNMIKYNNSRSDN